MDRLHHYTLLHKTSLKFLRRLNKDFRGHLLKTELKHLEATTSLIGLVYTGFHNETSRIAHFHIHEQNAQLLLLPSTV